MVKSDIKLFISNYKGDAPRSKLMDLGFNKSKVIRGINKRTWILESSTKIITEFILAGKDTFLGYNLSSIS